ncbi:MAG: efflux RND transporter periplasmic adaptor subunit [Caldimonas sp.]
MAFDGTRGALGAALLLAALTAGGGVNATGVAGAASALPPLASAAVRSTAAAADTAYDGVVQALRQTVIATQVPGAVVSLDAKVGDSVKAGQVLLRLDARAAEQTAAAAAAQVQAARAAQEAATKEFERQKQLFQKNYISQAALERAEAQHRAANAEALAQLAGAGAARTQSGFYVIRAPYAGVVADVTVMPGDMAMPGRPLLTLYDPHELRVSVAVPQTVAARLQPGQKMRVELPGVAVERIEPVKTQWLPTVDPSTHTLELRLDLPAGLAGATPGMFARAWLPGAISGPARLRVPAPAIVRRAEMTAVYVIGADGRPRLRQVRLGSAGSDGVEVLSGVAAGERVALDPQAAARVR